MSDAQQCLYVIRHGERLDEIDPLSWVQQVDEMYSKARRNSVTLRSKHCAFADAPLTPNGVTMAQDMAISFKKKLDDDGVVASELKCIYSSRLLRAVQTAYEVARVLELPLVISAHLSCTAQAVTSYHNEKVHACEHGAKHGWEGFEFLSMSELASHCPGVQLYSHDADLTPDDWFCFARRVQGEHKHHHFVCPESLRFNSDFEKSAVNAAMVAAVTKTAHRVDSTGLSDPIMLFGGGDDDDADDEKAAGDKRTVATVEPLLPNQWYNAINSVCAGSASRNGRSVVVAHRETIRGLEEYGEDSPDAASLEYGGPRLWKRAQRLNAPPATGVNWRMTKLPYCAVAKYVHDSDRSILSSTRLELTELGNHLCDPLNVTYFSSVTSCL